MSAPPTLISDRLSLRPLNAEDVPGLVRVFNHPEVAAGVLTAPHPYTEHDARTLLTRDAERRASGELFVWGVVDQARDRLVGVLGRHLRAAHRRAMIGYNIEPCEWGKGYATEAIARVADHAFREADPPLHKLAAEFFPENPASGRVLHKNGFTRVGLLRGEYLKGDAFKDVVRMELLREDWLGRAGAPPAASPDA